MQKINHTHRIAKTRTECFTSPIHSARHPNPAAHGDLCVVRVCLCGAERRTNLNGRYAEFGEWIPTPTEDR